MVRTIVANRIFDCQDRLGSFLDENDYDILVDEDCDGYLPALSGLEEKICCGEECGACDTEIDEDRIAFVFRKNFFTIEEQTAAYNGLHKAAVSSQNRGLA